MDGFIYFNFTNGNNADIYSIRFCEKGRAEEKHLSISRKEVAGMLERTEKTAAFKNQWFPYVQIVLACLIWGSYGLFVQMLPYPPEVVVFFRFLFGAITLVVFAALTGKLSQLKPSSHWKTMVVISAINSTSWLALSRAITYTSVGNGFILYYTAPCFVVMLAPLLLKERLEKKSVAALVFCFVGIVTIMGLGELGSGERVWQGNLLGLSSGLTYALYVLGLKRMPESALGLNSNVYLCGVISLISLPLALPAMSQVTFSGLLVLVALGILIQGVATTTYMVGLRKVKAQHASILSYSEALFAMLFSMVFLQESLTLNVVIGGLLIFVGGVIIVRKGKKEPAAPRVNQISI